MIEPNTQENKYPLSEDVETIDGIIKAYYEVVSGPAGQPRQWIRDNSLHHPKALIVFTGKDKDNNSYASAMSLDEFHADNKPYENGFFETEIHRETLRFGNIAHAWSTYDTKRGDGSTSRGINSIQLYHDGSRWWIISWMFDSERLDNAIPKAFL